MTESRRSRLWRFRAARYALGVASLVVLATPFAFSARAAVLAGQVGTQHSTAKVNQSGADLARYRDFEASTRPSAPIVLFYRDIRPVQPGLPADVIDPGVFAGQMAMLDAAGYTTLTSAQLAAYLDGAQVPPRSVVLTFDGGKRGAWVYADLVLRRYGFHGLVFVPSAIIGSRPSGQLTWAELGQMLDSGRWDVESQGRSPDALVPYDADGALGGFLTYRAWLPGERRKESTEEFGQRVGQELTEAKADLLRRGFPSPRFLAYPVSDLLQPGDGPPSHPLTDRLAGRIFRAVMVTERLPGPVSRRAAATGRLPRLRVEQELTGDRLFRRLVTMTTLEVEQSQPFASRSRWALEPRGDKTAVFGDDSLLFTSQVPGRLEARYALAATEDWTSYRLELTVDDLADGDTETTAGLWFLDGSPARCEVRLTAGDSTLVCQDQAQDQVAVRDPLPRPGPSHRVELLVSPPEVVVKIDGLVTYRRPPPAGGPASGGFGLSVSRPAASSHTPSFHGLRLRPLR